MDTQNSINKIAAKLFNEGVTPENYTKEKANKILSNCVAPVFCKNILKKYENDVIVKVSEFITNKNNALKVAIGYEVANLLSLKVNKTTGYLNTTIGTKSIQGLGAVILRIVQEQTDRINN